MIACPATTTAATPLVDVGRILLIRVPLTKLLQGAMWPRQERASFQATGARRRLTALS
jgi:hypothetical protein